MSLTIEMLLGKNGFDEDACDEKQIMMDAMKSARDDFISSALGYEGYSSDEDVGLDDVTINGAKEPKRLITRAESWNDEIDGRLEKEFQKVLRIYEANPQEGFVKALSSACDYSLDSNDRTSCYAIKKLLESYDDEVAYGTDYGIIFNSCGCLHAKLYDEELQEIREHPEKFFVAIISVHGE